MSLGTTTGSWKVLQYILGNAVGTLCM